jgi:hypothetical protein
VSVLRFPDAGEHSNAEGFTIDTYYRFGMFATLSNLICDAGGALSIAAESARIPCCLLSERTSR